jgi:Ca2+-binding RTX toxin-like protein
MAVGDGSVTMLGSTGNDIFYGGDGFATITGNGGADAFIFGNEGDGHQGGQVTITDWTSSDNFVVVDYGANAAQDAVNAATVTDAGLTATLSDGTTIIFQNVTDPSVIHNQSFGSMPV